MIVSACFGLVGQPELAGTYFTRDIVHCDAVLCVSCCRDLCGFISYLLIVPIPWLCASSSTVDAISL